MAKYRLLHWFSSQRKVYPHDNIYQSLIIALAFIACIYSIFSPRPVRTRYAFHSLILVFIAQSIAFGFQRALYPERVLYGAESAIIALSAFIQASMEMRKKRQLGGLVILVGGISGILWGMRWASFKKIVDQRILQNASRICVAISAILLGLSKAPIVFGKADRLGILQPLLLAGAALLRLYTNRKWEEKVLTAFYIISIVANLFESIYYMLNTAKAKVKMTDQRRSPRRKIHQ